MSTALSELLARAPSDPDQRGESRAQLRHLVVVVTVTLALVAGWAAMAPVDGAVIAPAQLKVELNRRAVQHQEGGIVREVRVRDGERVQAGDPLLLIGDLRGEADLGVLMNQKRAAAARRARAEAESVAALGFDAPAELSRDAAAAPHLARERAVFQSHRQALDEQIAALQAQMAQARAQADALRAQIDSTAESSKLSDEELAINEQLAAQGYINRTRLISLQRVSADYRSRLGEVRGDLAVAQQHVAELQSRAVQLRLQYRNQATDELKEASQQVRDLEQRLRPSQDQVERQVVRAPVAGQVMALRVTAPGGVVAPRETLLEIVPGHEKLVIDARIAPQDVEHVHTGGTAEVRFVSSDARQMPLLPATVTLVSADRVEPAEPGRPYFAVTVEVDAAAFQRYAASMRLSPGMPAEVYLTTGRRTLLQYLAKPFKVFTLHALREPG